ncbi:MAG: HDOD domain-containing protein [Thermodesulfobacteria bacterium]|nr:HDOD domain-containing protein [Thermodesulfobacteriota bacterium]
MKIRADTLFAKARSLTVPVQPYNYRAALVLCQDQRATSRQLAEVITTDYGLTLRLFTTVYSAFFSLERKDILSVRYIVVLLGMVTLKDVIIKAPLLSQDEENLLILYMGSGLLISFMSEKVAQLAKLNHEKAQVCGLLQNIGEVACAASVPKIVRHCLLPDSFVIKRRRFARMCSGYNPRKLGEELARHWNLPDLIRIAILPEDFNLNNLPEEERLTIEMITRFNNLIKEGFSRRASRSSMNDILFELCDTLKIKRTALDKQLFKSVSRLEAKCPIFHKHLKNIGLIDRLLNL